jgi:PLP dependent protein
LEDGRMREMRVETVAERLARVNERIATACETSGRSPAGVTLVAVTKGVPPWAIQQAAAAGIRHFGENRIQETQAKMEELSRLADHVTWHLLGHLQTNKVKTALGLFDIIHSVDSLHLAEEISRRAPHTVPAFIEVNVAAESSKFGMGLSEVGGLYEGIARLPNIDVRGLMTVAPLADSQEASRPVFRRLRETAQELGLRELSMGMTDDFEVAVEEGATIVRIGRALYGERDHAREHGHGHGVQGSGVAGRPD